MGAEAKSKGLCGAWAAEGIFSAFAVAHRAAGDKKNSHYGT